MGELQSSNVVMGVFVHIEHDPIHLIFGKVFDIAVIGRTMILSVQDCIGTSFSTHYNRFVIKAKVDVRAVDIHGLLDHRPLHARQTWIEMIKIRTYRYLTLCNHNTGFSSVKFSPYCICTIY